LNKKSPLFVWGALVLVYVCNRTHVYETDGTFE
jgi:hypothetical protein